MDDVAAQPSPAPTAGLTFPRRMRIGEARRFAQLRRSPVRKIVGPVTVYGLPNDLPHPRLGLSIGRPVGTAVTRARLKRLIRESFRLLQRDLPPGYDLLVSVRRHDPFPPNQYQDILLKCAQSIHRAWTAKGRQTDTRRGKPGSPP